MVTTSFGFCASSGERSNNAHRNGLITEKLSRMWGRQFWRRPAFHPALRLGERAEGGVAESRSRTPIKNIFTLSCCFKSCESLWISFAPFPVSAVFADAYEPRWLHTFFWTSQ